MNRRHQFTNPSNAYFIVLDEAPIKGSPTPKYDLMFGNPRDAIGTSEGSASTIEALLRMVPVEEAVYRTYLRRTDGRTGCKMIREARSRAKG